MRLRAFTMIELIICVAVLAIIMSVIVPSMDKSFKNSPYSIFATTTHKADVEAYFHKWVRLKGTQSRTGLVTEIEIQSSNDVVYDVFSVRWIDIFGELHETQFLKEEIELVDKPQVEEVK